MTTAVAAEKPRAPVAAKPAATRITSIDALRGFVMFTMIFVNDLAGAPRRLVPNWMVHFSDRHHGGSGMTFVDLVFPGFLFIVGMSIPFALGSRLAKGEPVWKTILHVLARTVSLLAIGILMVNGESAADAAPGWSPVWWATLMFFFSMLAFCTLSPRAASGKTKEPSDIWKTVTIVLRVIGFAGMIYCAFAFRGENDRRIITLNPLHLHVSWYGILGLIGWAYFAAAILYLVFRGNRTALLGCVVLMTCSFAADKHGFFRNFWPDRHIVDFGGTLGSQAAITVAGLLLASILVAPDKRTNGARFNFTVLFIVGFAIAALLVEGLYGISKNEATPSWCLWASAITAALWLGFYFLCDVTPAGALAKPLAIAGQNVLLAYLISEMLPSLLDLLHLGDFYGSLAEGSLAGAVARSAGCAAVILAMTAMLNRVGFRLKL
jgi:heparan-alpha-glucosaminide N-acetyltransferase